MRMPEFIAVAIYSVGYYMCRFAIWSRGYDWDHYQAWATRNMEFRLSVSDKDPK